MSKDVVNLKVVMRTVTLPQVEASVLITEEELLRVLRDRCRVLPAGAKLNLELLCDCETVACRKADQPAIKIAWHRDFKDANEKRALGKDECDDDDDDDDDRVECKCYDVD